jgi:hypothetical protein
MKTRIALTTLLLAGWGFLNRGIIYPVDVVAKNTLAVNTVNGGDAAFIAQNAYNAGSNSLTLVSTVVILSLLVLVWAKPLSKYVAP